MMEREMCRGGYIRAENTGKTKVECDRKWSIAIEEKQKLNAYMIGLLAYGPTCIKEEIVEATGNATKYQ